MDESCDGVDSLSIAALRTLSPKWNVRNKRPPAMKITAPHTARVRARRERLALPKMRIAILSAQDVRELPWTPTVRLPCCSAAMPPDGAALSLGPIAAMEEAPILDNQGHQIGRANPASECKTFATWLFVGVDNAAATSFRT